MSASGSLGFVLARWVGPLGLALFGAEILLDGGAGTRVIADVGLVLLVIVAVLVEVSLQRRWREDPSPAEDRGTVGPR